MAQTITETERHRQAQLKHGQRSDFAETQDETALTEPQRSRLAEIRINLETPSGVHDALREHASNMLLIFEWGMSWLQNKAMREGTVNAFESKMLQRFFTSAAEARRSLEALTRLRGDGIGGLEAERERIHRQLMEDDDTD